MSGEKESRLTHFDDSGKPRMVDVAEKNITTRTAIARGIITMSRDALARVKSGDGKKGDAVAVAELAGIMGAKRTSDLIPLCHPLPIHGVTIESTIDDEKCAVAATARVKTIGKTGVEMEALTAASVACLTLYDMLKAIDKSMVIERIALVEKTGGASGDFRREQ